MLQSTSTTFVKRYRRHDQVQWFGTNCHGTLAYGLHYYNGGDNVKIYRANLFGSVHEIADIEFAGVEDRKHTYNAHRHEIYWLHEVDSAFLQPSQFTKIHALVIFNVVTGDLQRYYTKECYHFVRAHMISAVSDVIAYLTRAGDWFHLYQIELNPVESTFSLCFLAEIIPLNDILYLLMIRATYSDSVVYTGDELIIFDDEISVEYLCVYDLSTKRWHLENVVIECETPESLLPMPSYCGHFFYKSFTLDDEICLFELDAKNFTWKLAFTGTSIHSARRENRASWLVSNDAEVVFSIWQPMTTVDACMQISITVYCAKFLSLEYMCLRELWRFVHQWFTGSTDHEILDHLALSSLVDVNKYFGRRFK